jgi:hypothetical protein
MWSASLLSLDFLWVLWMYCLSSMIDCRLLVLASSSSLVKWFRTCFQGMTWWKLATLWKNIRLHAECKFFHAYGKMADYHMEAKLCLPWVKIFALTILACQGCMSIFPERVCKLRLEHASFSHSGIHPTFASHLRGQLNVIAIARKLLQPLQDCLKLVSFGMVVLS